MEKGMSKKKKTRGVIGKSLGLITLFIIITVAATATVFTAIQNVGIKRLNSKSAEPFVASTFTTNQKVENQAANPLDLYVISDTHIQANAAHTAGQIDFAETEAITRAAFERIIEDDSIENVLLTGDLTNFGDRESCASLVELLNSLVYAGKNVYPLPATHDFGHGRIDPNIVGRDEVSDIYKSFSQRTGKIIAESPFDNGYSYVVQIAEGYRLLVINADYIFTRGYTAEELAWVIEQIEASRRAGDYIFSMQHYPLLLPTPLYPYFGSNDWHEWHLGAAEKMADAGLEFAFCGHSHMHSVVDYKTAKGNTIYSVSTAPLAGSPGLFRKVRFSYENVKIESVSLTAEELKSVGIETGGKNGSEYMRERFGKMILDMVHYAATDMDKFVEHSGELQIGLSPEKLKNDKTLYAVIQNVGKVLDTIKVKELKNALLYFGKIDESFGNRYVKDFLVELITGVSYGGMHYEPGTSEYLFAVLLIERAKPILEILDRSGKLLGTVENIRDGLLYKDGPDDWNLTLPRLN
ncbi:MAG: metallophosphoesterase [Clostridiales bacterium]|jgi:3',5'-cyclic AMP phosphodiesterase CpdA|nr:metallophosphoesterase [Clostridiales bacterium]